jgi:hypothetical protein
LFASTFAESEERHSNLLLAVCEVFSFLTSGAERLSSFSAFAPILFSST